MVTTGLWKENRKLKTFLHLTSDIILRDNPAFRVNTLQIFNVKNYVNGGKSAEKYNLHIYIKYMYHHIRYD